MMICTVVLKARTKDAQPYSVQFGFNGGFVGWITQRAKQIAKDRKAVVVRQPEGWLVDCQQGRDNSLEWLGDI